MRVRLENAHDGAREAFDAVREVSVAVVLLGNYCGNKGSRADGRAEYPRELVKQEHVGIHIDAPDGPEEGRSRSGDSARLPGMGMVVLACPGNLRKGRVPEPDCLGDRAAVGAALVAFEGGGERMRVGLHLRRPVEPRGPIRLRPFREVVQQRFAQWPLFAIEGDLDLVAVASQDIGDVYGDGSSPQANAVFGTGETLVEVGKRGVVCTLEKVPNDAYDAGDFLAGGAWLIDCIRQAAYETGLLERAPGHRGLLTVANEAEARGQRRRTERFENLSTAAEGGTRELVLVERLVGDARSVAVRLLAEC